MIGATTHFVPPLLLTHNQLFDSLTHFIVIAYITVIGKVI